MNDSNSLLQDLLESFPQLQAQIYFKTSLTALSHAIEDIVLASTEQPLVIANFQQERFYRQEAARYRRIAQRTDQVYVLAAPETDFASVPAPYATIGLEQTDTLAQEWHLAIVGQNFSACLICREYAAPVDAIDLDSARQFRGFWTFDPDVSRQAALLLCQRIGRYRPDLADRIELTKQRYQLTTEREGRSALAPNVLDAQLFIDRLVTYLQASQYKQVRSYRRIVADERRERLVNQIAAAVRQSLRLDDILAVTMREISQLFGQCRCLLYHLPRELSTPPSFTGVSEYEFVPRSEFGSLLGQNWRLATHPQFQPMLARGNIISIADTSQDLGIQAYLDLQQQLAQAQIQACLLVPIYVGIAQNEPQQCLGAIELHRDRPHLWTVADRELLAAIATQVSIALIQAEAFVHLQQLNQQLVAVKQTQTNLIAIVGHELRTPLSTIQVCLESLDTEPDMPVSFRQSMVETALADSERLRRLIQDFLLLSRLESNLTNWQLEQIDLADAISLAVSHLQAVAQPRNLPTISIDLPAKVPLAIADNEALFQLLSKILDNACKFTPPTGTISVTIEEVAIPTAQRPHAQRMLAVRVADTGCGIEPDRLETIFERFHQEEGFLQRAVGGAGLGLAICRQLARQLGGQIWATSQGKGRGSQFYVTVPVLVD
jgi:DICT domain-containing protein/signal transduction histidine kinase